MTAQTFFEQAGIPLLLFVICMYYGFKLVILQDVSAIRGKNKEPVKDEKAYAKNGGKYAKVGDIGFYGFHWHAGARRGGAPQRPLCRHRVGGAQLKRKAL